MLAINIKFNVNFITIILIYNLSVDNNTINEQQKNENDEKNAQIEKKIFEEQKKLALEYYKKTLNWIFPWILIIFIIFILSFLFFLGDLFC